MILLFFPLFLFSNFSLQALHIFQHQIPFLYPGCIFLLFVPGSPVLFIFFCSYLYIVHIHRVINHFLRFGKFVALSTFPKVTSLLLQIEVMKANHAGIWIFEFLPLIGFDLMQPILPSSFPWLSRWSSWFCQIFSTFSESLLSKSAGLYHRTFLNQSMPCFAFFENVLLFIFTYPSEQVQFSSSV